MSASCSIEPDSRRSERIGRLSWRCSTARESWDRATIGTLEVAGEHLQLPRDLRDLLDAALGGAAGGHELQVVDDDQPEARQLRLQPPGLRAELHHRDRARVVDVDRRLHQLVARRRSSRGQSSAARRPERSRCDSTFASRAHEPLGHLRLRHLEREQRDGRLVPHAEVRRHAEGERGLPHRRPRRHDDQVPRLEPGRDPVEVAVPRRDARDLGAGLVQRRDPLERLLQKRLDVAELARDALLGELEHDLLGPVDEVRRLPGPVPAEAGDLAARPGSGRAASRSRGRCGRSGAAFAVAGTRAASSWTRERPPTASSSPRSSSSSISVIASTGSPFPYSARPYGRWPRGCHGRSRPRRRSR